jgi:N6-adenosine-specific RNA methylase IME4
LHGNQSVRMTEKLPQRKRNPDRRCKRTRAKTPSAALYLGYADDGESVEMIMKKFELLEKKLQEIAQKNAAEVTSTNSQNHNQQIEESPLMRLSEKEQEEIFKMTSTFKVPTGDELEQYIQSNYDEFYDEMDFKDNSEDEDEFLSEEEFFAEVENKKTPSKKRGERATKRQKKPTIQPKTISMEVTDANGFTYTLRKKIRVLNPLAPVYIRVPSAPIPRSWGPPIAPYQYISEETSPPGSLYIETDIISVDLTTLKKKFLAALIDFPWKVPGVLSRSEDLLEPKQLLKLKLDVLIPIGFIFLWTEKEMIAAAIKTLEKIGFYYVENLCWVKLSVNNKFVERPYRYFNSGKTSLLIFRKGDGFQLRHQRNPDVILDFVLPGDKYLTENKPRFVYEVIETLLPEGNYKEGKQEGSFLELWAPKGMRRSGWTTIAQKQKQTTANIIA